MKDVFVKIVTKLKNPYIAVTVIFIVWISVIDSFNLIHQYIFHDRINSLEQKKEYYLQEIRKDSALYHILTTYPDSLEKYGREEYFMKKKSEDIFLVVEEED